MRASTSSGPAAIQIQQVAVVPPGGGLPERAPALYPVVLARGGVEMHPHLGLHQLRPLREQSRVAMNHRLEDLTS